MDKEKEDKYFDRHFDGSQISSNVTERNVCLPTFYEYNAKTASYTNH
jgi:hypothetical protein